MSIDHIARRTLLECAARLLTVPVGLQFFSAWTQAVEAQQHAHPSTAPVQVVDRFSNYQPQFFSPADFEALQALSELLIPTDDTPGAREAYCSQFIDFVLHSMDDYAPDTQQQWRAALKALQESGFHSAHAEGRVKLLEAISKPERDHSVRHPAYFAYRLIKRENAFAFYTSRIGMIENLNYRGNSFNVQFPACTHPEHHRV